jgi:hypothetical protein
MSELHITKEVMKAETRLKRIRRTANNAIDKVTMAWLQREADYIDKLPEEVKRGLRACGVIGTAAPVFPASEDENMDATVVLS